MKDNEFNSQDIKALNRLGLITSEDNFIEEDGVNDQYDKMHLNRGKQNSNDYLINQITENPNENEISNDKYNTEIKTKILGLLDQFFIPFSNNMPVTFPYISKILTAIQFNIENSGLSLKMAKQLIVMQKSEMTHYII